MSLEGNNTKAMFSGMKHAADTVPGKKRCLGCMKQYDEKGAFCPHCGYPAEAEVENALHLYPGSVLQDRYVIGRVIGYGGFGTTYLAWDHVLQRERAIKEYLPSEFSTRGAGQTRVTVFTGDKTKQFADGLEKFVDEAKKLAKFNNENGIVKIYDSFEENNTAYIVMEYLNGETLAQKLEREITVSADEAIKILTPVIDSLKHVHGAGIVHRDIAPDNIFLTKDGQVKLIDFGAARFATTSKSRSLTVIIKPGYSAEEQYRSRGDQGPHTDVYSLGAVFYKMVTGVTPPDALERRANYEKNHKDILVPITKYNKDIPANIETAIYNAMNVRIEDRTENMSAFLGELNSSTKVKRRKGTIRKIDLYRWPLWAKIAVPASLGVLVTLCVLLGLGIIGPNTNGMFDFEIPDGQTRVPDVVTQELEEAEKKLEKNDLSLIIANRMESEIIAENTVLLQDPDAGNIVNKGTLINITVSAGKEKAFVEKVVNYTKELAQQILEQAGFKVEIKEEYNDTVAPGSVISQSAKDGEELEKGATVTLTVSKGKKNIDITKKVKAPDVTGMTFEEARKYLGKYDLYVAINDTVYSEEYPSGQILGQTPPKGEQLKAGDTIGVSVSLGVKKVYVPDVVYRKEDTALSMMKEAELTVTVKYAESKTVAKGTVISQSVDGGKEVKVGTKITLVVSKGYTVSVPDVRNMDYKKAQDLLTENNLESYITYKNSSSVAKNDVISQSVAPNTKVNQGTAVELVVSSGEMVVYTTVPTTTKPTTTAPATTKPTTTKPATTKPITTKPTTTKPSVSSLKVGDIIEFGSYPQSRVTDSSLISSLNAQSKSWKSYGYYTGTGKRDDGNMKSGDWMKYADITYGGKKYRAVTFSQYRPEYTGYTSSESNSFQDNNGYSLDTVYYFEFAPLKWRVLDASKGLLMSEKLIDSQAYNNTVYYKSAEDYQFADCSTYANDYASSSIRKWLNDDFYNAAFSNSEKSKILSTNCDNSASHSEYSSVSTNDKVFLLSYSDVKNSAYGFSTSTDSSESRKAYGTDYARCQGLYVVFSSQYVGKSLWLLRTAGHVSSLVKAVGDNGDPDYGGRTYSTSNGVRPAIRISNIEDYK